MQVEILTALVLVQKLFDGAGFEQAPLARARARQNVVGVGVELAAEPMVSRKESPNSMALRESMRYTRRVAAELFQASRLGLPANSSNSGR